MRIATWNVNSLKARIGRVEAWLAEVAPDVVCLQETKLADDAFPALGFAGLGYESAHQGQGQWNGVAILSKVGLSDVTGGFDDGGAADPEARLITATCAGVRVSSVYVPNGRSPDHEQYRYKLDWLERLSRQVAATGVDGPVLVAGDFNIAPTDADVWSPQAFEGATHVSAPERSALEAFTTLGLVDLFRVVHPTATQVFSWWDYRAGDFHEGRGMRIDLALGSPPLADRTRWAIIDRNARKGSQPSDHAPLVIDVEL